MTLLFGLAALAVLLWMAQKYLQADPRKLAAMAKPMAGTAVLGFAGFLALRGQYALAAPLVFVGFGLLGWVPFGPASSLSAGSKRKSPKCSGVMRQR